MIPFKATPSVVFGLFIHSMTHRPYLCSGFNSSPVLGFQALHREENKSWSIHSQLLSYRQDLEVESCSKTSADHPHDFLWSSTLQRSPNSLIHPSVILAIRPPTEGGTGIIATQDIPENTIIMSLRLEEVGMIDAVSILDSYKLQMNTDDAVLDMLCEMWDKDLISIHKSSDETHEGKRLAVLAGIIAHLQLTRYKDLTVSSVKDGFALIESRRLGPFLDAMPLLPQHSNSDLHPFPTHYLFWSDEEIEHLLMGTIGQTKAREVRAGVGLIVREWSDSFLREHSMHMTQADILNAIFSAFASVLSRSFGDAAGRDLDGKGRMLVPMVDMLNHDGENPNVSWKWHVGQGDEELISEGKGDIVVTTLRFVRKGEELFKCYGWRPAWDIASSYGFVPRLEKERWECAAIPLFPSTLDLVPDDIPSPVDKATGVSSLDLLLEVNYGPLVKAVLAAVDASVEIQSKRNDGNCNGESQHLAHRPPQLKRIEVLSLFRQPPVQTPNSFLRRQPCIVAGTKLDITGDRDNKNYHRYSIEFILPAFRAAASAISQIRVNHQSGKSEPILASQMALAAGSMDSATNWDGPAINLISHGINDRIQNLNRYGKDAELWLENDTTKLQDYVHSRAQMARDIRDAELKVLQALKDQLGEW